MVVCDLVQEEKLLYLMHDFEKKNHITISYKIMLPCKLVFLLFFYQSKDTEQSASSRLHVHVTNLKLEYTIKLFN